MSEQADGYYKYLVLGEFILSLCCNFSSIFNCCKIFKYQYYIPKIERLQKISSFFFALLLNYLLAALFLLPYDIFVLSSWRPYASSRNGPVLFWISVFGHCWIATFPLIVFFLTLDRILTIKYPGGYKRARLLYALILLNIAFLLFNFISFYSALPVLPHTQCWTHGCLMETKLEFYLYWRTGCAFVNCITGFVFFFLMWKRQHTIFAGPSSANRAVANKANNFLTVMAVVVELCFNFAPHLFLLLFQEITDTNPSLTWGSYSSTLFTVESCIFTYIYQKLLIKTRALPSPSTVTSNNNKTNQ